MKTRRELFAIAQEQLAIEYNCSPDDFSKPENSITVARKDERARHYIDGTFFFQMATFGGSAVISADSRTHEWLRNFIQDKTGHWLFEHPNLVQIDTYLRNFNKQLLQTHHMFLSDTKVTPKNPGIPIRWFEGEAIHQFYEGRPFPNALTRKYDPKCPDVLAVAAYDGDTIIGMAGCTADTPVLYQIGIDVHQHYRGRGIGTYLVVLLKAEIENRNRIPLYGTSLSNLHSWNIALNCGFFPAWVGVATKEE